MSRNLSRSRKMTTSSSFHFFKLNYKLRTTAHSALFSTEIGPLDRLLRMKPMLKSRKSRPSELSETVNPKGFPTDDDFEEEEEDIDPRAKLGKQILSMGRVRNRHIEPLPEWVRLRQSEISKFRTPAQIRRCVKSWMLKPERDLQSRYLGKEVGWFNKNSTKRSLSKDEEDEDEEEEDYSRNEMIKKESYAYGPEEAVAYSYYFFPSRFSIMKRILNEIKTLIPTFNPQNTLDFGCGIGTAGASLLDVWGFDPASPSVASSGPSDGNTASRGRTYTGIDISLSMIDAAKILLEQRSSINTIHSSTNNKSSSNSRFRDSDGDQSKYDISNIKFPDPMDCLFYDRSADFLRQINSTNRRYEMAFLAYILNDLPDDKSRQAATQLCFELLQPGGILVIVESGNPMGSHSVRSARQFILNTFNSKDIKIVGNRGKDRDGVVGTAIMGDGIQMALPAPAGFSHGDIGASVVAPCTHDGACPLRTGFWCSFSQKVVGGVIRKDSEEKFSYVVIQKVIRPTSVLGSGSKANTPQKTTDLRTLSPDVAAWTSQNVPADKSLDEGVFSVPSNQNQQQTETFPRPLTILRKFMEIASASKNQPNKSLSKVGKKQAGVVRGFVNALIDKYDWEEYVPELFRKEWARVIRSPIKADGHITVDVCHPSGSLHRLVLSRASLSVPMIPGPFTSSSLSLYSAVRKITWGGLFPALSREEMATHHSSTGSTYEKREETSSPPNAKSTVGRGKENQSLSRDFEDSEKSASWSPKLSHDRKNTKRVEEQKRSTNKGESGRVRSSPVVGRVEDQDNLLKDLADSEEESTWSPPPRNNSKSVERLATVVSGESTGGRARTKVSALEAHRIRRMNRAKGTADDSTIS